MSKYGSVVERVDRGRNWLLTEGPQFGLDIERIDTARLEVQSTFACVLAQASGEGFWSTLHKVGRDAGWAEEHGFMCHHADGGFTVESCDGGQLEDEWRRALTAAVYP